LSPSLIPPPVDPAGGGLTEGGGATIPCGL
jgi:hypothetical protein